MSFRISEHSLSDGVGSTPRKVWVHEAVEGPARDCLLWLDGELYLERLKAPEILAKARAAGDLPPLTCVYLTMGGTGRHGLYACNETFASFLAHEMPRWIGEVTGGFERLYLGGLSLSGLQALYTGLHHEGVFAGILAQSPSAWWQEEWLVSSLVPGKDNRTRYWLSVGTKEVQENLSHPPTPLYQRTSQLDSVRRLAAGMSRAGHEIHLNEFEGGHDPACWAAEMPEAIGWLVA